MIELNLKIRISFDELEPHEWVASHLEGYVFQNSTKEIKENFIKYTNNKYTYYQEVKEYYEKFINNFYFDIHAHESGNKGTKMECLNLIIAKSSNYYFVELEAVFFPIGFLREQFGSADIHALNVAPILEKYEKYYDEENTKRIFKENGTNIIDGTNLNNGYCKKANLTNRKIFQIIAIIIIFTLFYSYFNTRWKVNWIFHLIYTCISFYIISGWFFEIKSIKLIENIDLEINFINQFYSKLKYRIKIIIDEIKSYFNAIIKFFFDN